DDIPVMIGGTREESAFFLADDDAVWNSSLSEAELRQRVAAVAGAETEEVLAAYRMAMPQASPGDRLIAALTGSNFLDPHSTAGGALCSAAPSPGLHVLARLAEPRTCWPPQGAPCDGSALRLRQCRCGRHDRRRAGRPAAGRAHFSDLDRLRPERDPGQSRDPILAALLERGTRDD